MCEIIFNASNKLFSCTNCGMRLDMKRLTQRRTWKSLENPDPDIRLNGLRKFYQGPSGQRNAGHEVESNTEQAL